MVFKVAVKNYDETARETRANGITVVECSITIDESGKTVFHKRFPLPQRTFSALKAIIGEYEFYVQKRIEEGAPLGEHKLIVKFSNIPDSIKAFLNESTLKQFIHSITGKTPPLGIPFIIRALKRKYSNVVIEVKD